MLANKKMPRSPPAFWRACASRNAGVSLAAMLPRRGQGSGPSSASRTMGSSGPARWTRRSPPYLPWALPSSATADGMASSSHWRWRCKGWGPCRWWSLRGDRLSRWHGGLARGSPPADPASGGDGRRHSSRLRRLARALLTAVGLPRRRRRRPLVGGRSATAFGAASRVRSSARPRGFLP